MTYHPRQSEMGHFSNKLMIPATMPVIPCGANLFQDSTELHRFLLTCQNQGRGDKGEQIVSFCQRIEPVDLLAVLHAIAQPRQLHFYWENCTKEEGILGYGSLKSLTVDGRDRFQKAKHFIQRCQQQITRVGNLHLGEGNPHFFCNFTFFDTPTHANSPFPGVTVFLPRLQIIRQQNQYLLVANLAINDRINLELSIEQLQNQLQLIKLYGHNRLTPQAVVNAQIDFQNQNQSDHHFQQSVTSVLKSIEDQKFSKIVLAHAIDVAASQPFNIIASLSNLRDRHPDCYIFSVSNTQGHHFIGASPERLLSIHQQQLVTDALAGSAPRGNTRQQDHYLAQQLLQSEKEMREHQAVADFLMHSLQQLGLHPHKSPQKLLQLSNIQHLWTPIYAKLIQELHPLDIVAKLHPTPAVAGVPTNIACEQIRFYENFDRTLYAAPIGWLDHQGNSEFIVGIRSALIKDNQARLYGGAGIVAGSDPDKEFAEVQLKLQSLLKSLA